jgi:hypothetical protein
MKLVLRVFAVLLALAAATWFASSLDVESEAVPATPAATSSALEGAAPSVDPVTDDPAAALLVTEREPTRAPAPKEAALEPKARSTDEFARLDVRVVSRDTGAGVPNHRVTAFVASGGLAWKGRPGEGSVAMPGESAATDQAGRATLYVAPHTEHVVASLDMFQETYRAGIPRLAALQSAEAKIRVPTEADIVFCGRVVDAERLTPLAGARVRIVDRPSSAILTDALGAFELRGHSWADKRIRIEAEPYLPFATPLERGHETADGAYGVRLSRAAALDVLVLSHDGRPARATVIVARSREAGAPSTSSTLSSNEWTRSSSSAGRAIFESLPANVPLEIRIRSELRYPCTPRPLTLTSGVTASFEWRLEPTGTIRGRVVDANGAAVAGQSVELRFVATNPTVASSAAHIDGDVLAQSSDDGAFEFRDVPLGRWRIALGGDRWRSATGGEMWFDASDGRVAGCVEFELDSQHVVREIELRLEAGAYIRGSVLTSQGEPARTTVFATQTDGQFSATAKTNKSGEFVIGPLPQGEFTLLAIGNVAQGANSARVQVESGAVGLELRLAPAGSLRVRLVSPSGEPVDGNVSLEDPKSTWPQTRQTTRGACKFEGIASGRVTLRATSATGTLSAELEVEVVEGPTPTVVELVMRPATRAGDR